MTSRSRRARPLLLAVLAVLACAPADAADEWPGLRGPNHDGSAGRGSRFAAGPGAPVVRWRTKIGSGYSGVAVSGGRLATLFADGGTDVLAAFDAASGKELWRIPIAPTYKGLNGSFDGPLSTPAIGDGRVFALGAAGQLVAADLATGRELWRVDLPAREGAVKPELGFASSPLVAAGMLVLQVGGPGRAIAGFDPATGERRWSVGDDVVQYQAPVVVRVGRRDIVVAAGDTRLIGVDPASGGVAFDHAHGGEPVWIASNSAVPTPAGNGRLFVKTRVDTATMYRLAEDAGGRIAPSTLWTAPVLRQTYAPPVYHDGHLYGMNGRTVFTCVDAETGELKWRAREPGDGFYSLAGDQIVVVTKAHTLHVGPASPQGWQERARLELFPEHLAWTAPTVAGDALFARSLGELVRVDWKSEPAPPPPPRRGLPSPRRPSRASSRRSSARPTRWPRSIASWPGRTTARSSIRPTAWCSSTAAPRRTSGSPATCSASGARTRSPACPAPTSSITRRASSPAPAPATSSSPTTGSPSRTPATRGGSPAPRRATRPHRWPCRAGSSPLTWPSRHPRRRRGRIEIVELASASRPGAKTTLHVYLPAGYDGAADRYPVAYVLDGDGARAQGLVPRSLDNLVPGRVAPAIVVFVGRIDWGPKRPSSGEAVDASVALLAGEIVPLVDARFRTIAEPSARAVAGRSFDAVIAGAAAFADPGLFGALAMQSAFLLDVVETEIKARVRPASERPLRVYHDWGLYGHASTREARDLRAANRRFTEFLRSKGHAPVGGEARDGDGWASWRNRTDQLFAALFPPPSR